MPDETDSNQPPQPPQPPSTPEQRPSGGAYTQGEKISKINVADEIKNSFLDYSMSVIISRALPDVRDGLKPSQRRILYAMENLSLFPGRKHIKCAKICGDTSGYRMERSSAWAKKAKSGRRFSKWTLSKP